MGCGSGVDLALHSRRFSPFYRVSLSSSSLSLTPLFLSLLPPVLMALYLVIALAFWVS